MEFMHPEINDALYGLALRVRTQRDFARFVDRLAEDYETNREVWENVSIPEFLGALADGSRRANESAGKDEAKYDTPWQMMARLLLGATVLR